MNETESADRSKVVDLPPSPAAPFRPSLTPSRCTFTLHGFSIYFISLVVFVFAKLNGR